jgi:hypothetical protein
MKAGLEGDGLHRLRKNSVLYQVRASQAAEKLCFVSGTGLTDAENSALYQVRA